MSLLSNEYSAKWLELMKEAVPKLDRVAVLWNSDNPAGGNEVEHIREAARALGLDLTDFSVRPGDVEASFAAIANASFGGLLVTTDALLETLTPRIVAFTAERRLPAIYPFSDAVQQRGLMSYSPTFLRFGSVRPAMSITSSRAHVQRTFPSNRRRQWR